MTKRVDFVGFITQMGVPTAHNMIGILTDSNYIEHYIDGELRATVPPEGFADYIVSWPQLAPLLE